MSESRNEIKILLFKKCIGDNDFVNGTMWYLIWNTTSIKNIYSPFSDLSATSIL
jgi:hypothetical protein